MQSAGVKSFAFAMADRLSSNARSVIRSAFGIPDVPDENCMKTVSPGSRATGRLARALESRSRITDGSMHNAWPEYDPGVATIRRGAMRAKTKTSLALSPLRLTTVFFGNGSLWVAAVLAGPPLTETEHHDRWSSSVSVAVLPVAIVEVLLDVVGGAVELVGGEQNRRPSRLHRLTICFS